MGVGARVKYYREHHNPYMSQRELARRIGVTNASISECESKDGGMRPENLYKTSKILGVPFEILLIGPSPIDNIPEQPSGVFTELLGSPILAEGAALEGTALDYVFSGHPKIKKPKRNILGVLVTGDCLEPEIKKGDCLLVDIDLQPTNGDIIVCLMDDKIQIKRYREANGKKWLETRFGMTVFEECRIQGVVIEFNRKRR